MQNIFIYSHIHGTLLCWVHIKTVPSIFFLWQNKTTKLGECAAHHKLIINSGYLFINRWWSTNPQTCLIEEMSQQHLSLWKELLCGYGELCNLLTLDSYKILKFSFGEKFEKHFCVMLVRYVAKQFYNEFEWINE